LHFSYPSKKEVEVLNNINFQIKTNQVAAFVGESGCGKSSIISLIERFYDPDQGLIKFSGTDIRELEPRWYK
jgi:ATP-binding cassette, subfamily B (MDR/TAP), member 1